MIANHAILGVFPCSLLGTIANIFNVGYLLKWSCLHCCHCQMVKKKRTILSTLNIMYVFVKKNFLSRTQV